MKALPNALFIFSLTLFLTTGSSAAPKKGKPRKPSSNCSMRNFLEHFYIQNSKGAKPLVLDNYDLNNDGVNDLFVTDQRTCGSKGCEYYLYLKNATDCFQYVGNIDGHIIEVVNSKRSRYKKIKINQRNGHLGESILLVYEYASEKNSYQLIFSSADDEF